MFIVSPPQTDILKICGKFAAWGYFSATFNIGTAIIKSIKQTPDS